MREALAAVQPGERVLAIIPDKTRDDNTDVLFPVAADFLARRSVECFDALVAQGKAPQIAGERRSHEGCSTSSRVRSTFEIGPGVARVQI